MNLFKATLAAAAILFCGASYAQAPEITSYFPSDREDYRGYSITNVSTDLGRGYAAVGNHTAGGANRSVHFLVMPASGGGAIGSLLTFNHDDVRAVAINELSDGVVLLTLQVRDVSTPARIMMVMINCSAPASAYVMSAQLLGYGGINFHPLGATLDARTKTYYVCGYATPAVNVPAPVNYPAEPGHETIKYALVAKLDLSTNTGGFLVLNSPIDYTPPPSNSGWQGDYNDYDLVQRLKFINGRLYAVGSSNGTAQTAWTFGSTQGVNNSKIWVMQLNSSTLYPIQSNHFGQDITASMKRPDFEDGFHGTDIIEDVNNPGSFYVTGQDIYWHTWTITAVQPNLQVVPGTNSPTYANTLTYGYPADIKAHGAFTQNNDRISIYGTVNASSPFPMSPDIADVGYGAIPFVTSFEPAWGASGLSANNLRWWIEGNNPNTPTAMHSIHSPYLMASSMSRYGIPVFATQYDAASRKYDLAMMGHIGDGTPAPNISPRLILSDPDGEVSTCRASKEAPGTYPGVGGFALFDGAQFNVGTDGPSLVVDPERVDLRPWRHSEDNCTGGNVYRQQNGTAAQAGVRQSGSLALFPNPASDKLNVNLGFAAGGQGKVSVTFTDVTGRQALFLEKNAGTGSSLNFELPYLSPGLYHCTVRHDEKIIGTQKLSVR